MSTDAASATEPSQVLPVVQVDAQHRATDHVECAKQPQPAFLHSPPDSNNAEKSEASDSELSDLDDEPILDDAPMPPPPPPTRTETKDETKAEVETEPVVDIGEVLPDHWSGSVPVFRPTMDQFKDFKVFMEKVDNYGMKSGIIKIIPPKEWKDAQPPLEDLIKQVRVREPIKQDIMGSNGTYRQVNILHGRSYNVPQWRQLCEQSEHQPPARRGERRANAEKPKPQRTRQAAPKPPPSTAAPKPRGRGRPPKNRGRHKKTEEEARPMTPVSPKVETQEPKEEVMPSVENDPGTEVDDLDAQPTVRRMGGIKPAKPKTQSTSARRKYSRREGSAVIDEAAFKDFDYRMDISEFTPERCEELERVYWKTLTYAPPLYGADLMGTLFDEKTDIWNLNKLPNLLDVLGTKVPGVNTAYLYLGMWKATFAWHLEDVDLYSINYLHFGAPKQWYSISQADARRFEAAMKSIWPADAKACDQFLRHKAFLISPQHLLQNFGIKVNKCVSYPGEFVVTYPYGYHSGYNLGYNCAEAVNFALDSWLDMGKIAKKCECAQAQDSVWVNVYEIERKLRGEDTEYEETEEEEDDEDDDDDDPSGLPTPPASHGVKFKDAGRKRKRGPGDKTAKVRVKKIKLRLKVKAEPPCCLCPNDIPGMEILPTNDGRKAHRLCALYIPETYIDMMDGKEVISNVDAVHKDRLDLKCLFCRSKRGACFQCSQKKCARAYHPTCAAAAGVFIEEQDVPVFDEDGKEYKEQAFEFSCRFHRTKRDRKYGGDVLENDSRILAAARALKKGDICQVQYYKGDIFAGIVVENRSDEHALLIDVLPNGDRIEVEWKWLLLPDPADFHLPKASANAMPLPTSQKAKDRLNAKRQQDDKPRKDDIFGEGFTWAEFNTMDIANKYQVKVDFSKAEQIWYYLGKTSTEAKAQYTEDPSKLRFNPKGNYLDTLPKPVKPMPAPRPHYQQQYGFTGSYVYSNATQSPAAHHPGSVVFEKPYVYKPRQPVAANFNVQMYTPQRFTPNHPAPAPAPAPPSHQQHHYSHYTPSPGHQNSPSHTVQRFAPAVGTPQYSHPQASPASASRPASVQHTPTAMPPAMPPVMPPAMANPKPPAHHSKPTWQVHSSIFQKYPFYQINHNRDSSKYRTPYIPWGGFTNGYQGDLKAHLMANQQDLLRRSSVGSNPAVTQAAQAPMPPSIKQPSISGSTLPGTPSTAQKPVAGPPTAQQKSASASARSPGHQYHPAIKAQYRILAQQATPAQQTPPPTSKPKPASAPKPASTAKSSYKVGLPAAVSLSLKSTKSAIQIPIKQSPVPLPANFLAAMTSLPSTPASSSKPSPLNSQAQQAHSAKNTASPAGSQGSPANASNNSGPATKSAHPAKVSTTPVPLPTFSIPSQSAAQSNLSGTQPVSKVPQPSISQRASAPARSAITTTPKDSKNVIGDIVPPTAKAPNVKEGLSPTVGAPVAQTLGGNTNTQPSVIPTITQHQPQEFPDVPGCESMEFVERMIGNLRRASQRRVDG
ncbi:DNA damage-responsive transcriptional repressor RPH1 [Cladobotryum mycophilum]|uniref:[histone H3]-trimethyl-L-lysine(9) demethylase n=1 Tax=Cladobotryum mycophilum TaxID=491253 RepID=A0ABR0T199_9HYPO